MEVARVGAEVSELESSEWRRKKWSSVDPGDSNGADGVQFYVERERYGGEFR